MIGELAASREVSRGPERGKQETARSSQGGRWPAVTFTKGKEL